ncbi:MAG: AAA family ATPase [Planctomycetes bacterium]|nr:AAA family ATPase [Planctomycetota bacterium]
MSGASALLSARPEHASGTRAPFLFVTGGKGGVGKTLVAANLALDLARRGKRVLLADLDLALSNLNVMLQLPATRTLEAFFARRAPLQECIVTVPGGPDVLPAASGAGELAALPAAERRRLLDGLSALAHNYDLVLADGAAGIGADVLSFAAAADHVLLVTTPEPTALTDAYGLLKALHIHGEHGEREVPTPELVVNLATGVEEAESSARKLRGVCERFLARSPKLAGWLPRSQGVARSIERQQPFALERGRGDLELPLACLKQLASRVERLCPGSPVAGNAQAGGKLGR